MSPMEPTEVDQAALQFLQLLARMELQVNDALAAWYRGERPPPEVQLELRDRLLRLDGVLGQLEESFGEGG